MKIEKLNTWEDFESNIQNLSFFVKTHAAYSQPLFRGHGDSLWKLESTLARTRIGILLSYKKYYRIIRESSNIINNCFDCNWDIPEYEPPEIPHSFEPQAYGFMVYLRHNGFPSPLLDWTRSHYLAAFFAFNSHKKSDDVAIFSYIERLGHGKNCSSKDAVITSLGPNVKTHKRHYLQQSEYTICTKSINDEIYFAKHEDIVVKNNLEQDLFIKFILPACEKEKVLAKLAIMNINAYSLFGTQEALMNTLSNQHFLFEYLNPSLP